MYVCTLACPLPARWQPVWRPASGPPESHLNMKVEVRVFFFKVFRELSAAPVHALPAASTCMVHLDLQLARAWRMGRPVSSVSSNA